MKHTKEVWNEQYEMGRWDYLKDISESLRYSLLGFYCNWFHKSPTILDVGCGLALVAKYAQFTEYIGLDMSKTALEKAERERENL